MTSQKEDLNAQEQQQAKLIQKIFADAYNITDFQLYCAGIISNENKSKKDQSALQQDRAYGREHIVELASHSETEELCRNCETENTVQVQNQAQGRNLPANIERRISLLSLEGQTVQIYSMGQTDQRPSFTTLPSNYVWQTSPYNRQDTRQQYFDYTTMMAPGLIPNTYPGASADAPLPNHIFDGIHTSADPRRRYLSSQSQVSQNSTVQRFYPNTNPRAVNYSLARAWHSGTCASTGGSLPHQSINGRHTSADTRQKYFASHGQVTQIVMAPGLIPNTYPGTYADASLPNQILNDLHTSADTRQQYFASQGQVTQIMMAPGLIPNTYPGAGSDASLLNQIFNDLHTRTSADPRRRYLSSQNQASQNSTVQDFYPNTNPRVVNYSLAHPGYSDTCARARASLPRQSINGQNTSAVQPLQPAEQPTVRCLSCRKTFKTWKGLKMHHTKKLCKHQYCSKDA